ncbi:30S ribosomal protein S12 methylthiotransferase RimO [Saccharopolyspora antimicrobica]|uniref:Ribosomal protein uS12 methylthiotransferase RimO n=2 Tax=Saccharopolyspora antimicrobica TaxID=455193 RepID=A0ABX9TGN3_9PSEU|nr:30S ribosomal protein S12 methylthiotransferase RimO [Saccharopolyspora antimicrobica]RKT86054.1 SSU ribosomal protein S12P methylthiotransferase [Saccharopolyspora antimicrobica]
MSTEQNHRRVAMVTLGCARNEVDSEELAGNLHSRGWDLVDAEDAADVVVVNTCGFVESAKKDSVDTLLAASDTGAKVVAVGCMAERYGNELAEHLPEADAVLGFDHYGQLADRLDDVLAGKTIQAHQPQDRRKMLPISPVARPAAAAEVAVPGHGWVPAARSVARRRLDDSPVAALKLASGCDRRCSFCAIPSFRGSFLSRQPEEVLGEAVWLAEHGAKELFLVSENSTSYGKDLADPRALELLLPRLAEVEGVERVRVSYLQPAETRPGLVRTIASTPGVAPYFDLSFQHSSESVLRRMRRFGSTESFLALIEQIRELAPEAGIRSNFIVGFPGETEEDFAELQDFLTRARLDAVGVFGYSDEDGTEAAGFADKLDPEVVDERVEKLSDLVDELIAQRAEDRVGSEVRVLVERIDDGEVVGRADHQGPEVDGECLVEDAGEVGVGEVLRCRVVDSEGVDLVVRPVGGAPAEDRSGEQP